MATRKPIDGSRASSETMGSPTRPIAFVFTALLALRLANALSIQTFFQPDEYFQSLEPAWQMAFGPESGAWITWVGNPTDNSNATLIGRTRNGANIFGRPSIQCSSPQSIEQPLS